MKLVVIKPEPDDFDRAKQLLERDLTPQERRWLILANVLLKQFDRCEFVRKVDRKAA
jgi:hypothetical protein